MRSGDKDLTRTSLNVLGFLYIFGLLPPIPH